MQHPLHSTHARVGGLVGVLVGGWCVGTVLYLGGWVSVGECRFLLKYGNVCAYGGIVCILPPSRGRLKIKSMPGVKDVEEHLVKKSLVRPSGPGCVSLDL